MELAKTNGEEKLRKVWREMRSRCSNPLNTKFHRYGGRGIYVCDEWTTYPVFRAWALANGFIDGLTIDRIDNDGPYIPANCRWVTNDVQAQNRSNHVMITAFGETKQLGFWAQDPRCVVSYEALYQRVKKRKWDGERAITTPEIDSRAPQKSSEEKDDMRKMRASGMKLKEISAVYGCSVSAVHRYLSEQVSIT